MYNNQIHILLGAIIQQIVLIKIAIIIAIVFVADSKGLHCTTPASYCSILRVL